MQFYTKATKILQFVAIFFAKATLERELAPLQSINDHYPKYILTMDIDPIADFNGIKKMNVLDWLVSD